jgi:hypothetical protein
VRFRHELPPRQVRKSPNVRKRPLTDLFAATESGRGRAKWCHSLREGPGLASPLAWIQPSTIAIALAMSALVISVWQLVDSDGALQTVTAAPAGGVLGSTVTVTVTEQAPVAARAPVQEPKARPALLTLTAARGDCWLEVRAGSGAGKLLFAGLLNEGRSLRLVKRRLWLAFGAGGNLDVTLNGRRVESFPTGTAAVTITAQGVGPAATLSSTARG